MTPAAPLPSTSLAPSTPDPSLAALAAVLIRYVLMILSTLGVATESWTNSKIQMLASALVGLGTVAWALWDQIAKARHTHEVAVVNASRPAGTQSVQPG